MNSQIVGIDKFYLVSQLSLFANLSWLERRLVASKAYLVEYKKEQLIYREGDSPDALYCLATGRVELYTLCPDGSERILERLHRGSYFGIISLLTGDAHSVNVRAINDSIVVKINKADFNTILKFVPKLAIHMSQTLSRRLKQKDVHPKTVFESTIISIYSSVRGTGRTFYAINLALSLKKETAKRAILLDMSLEGTEVFRALGISAKINAIELQKTAFDYKKVNSAVFNHSQGIDILGIKHSPGKPTDTQYITPLLTYLANSYHYIIVDLPQEADQTVFKALTQSDTIHIITNPAKNMLKATRKFLEDLEKSAPETIPKIKIIVNVLKEKEYLNYKKQASILERKIYGTLPAVSPDKLTGIAIVILQPQSEYARMVRRIAREVGGMRIGLALGGGAALGLIHIGVLKVLEREKIPIDVVSGSSMGGLIAALWGSGKNAEEIEEIAAKLKSKFATLQLVDPVFPKAGLIGGRAVTKFLRKHLGNKTFQDVVLPIKIVACNIARREIIALDEGKLLDAVRASIAIPGIFTPVKRGKATLIDGGILEPIPIGTLIQIGTSKIIAVNPLPSPQDIRDRLENIHKEMKQKMEKRFMDAPLTYITCRIMAFLKKIFLPNISDIIVNTLQGMEYLMAETTCQQADVVIHPHMNNADWYEFYSVDKLVKMGEEETEKALPQIKKLLEE